LDQSKSCHHFCEAGDLTPNLAPGYISHQIHQQRLLLLGETLQGKRYLLPLLCLQCENVKNLRLSGLRIARDTAISNFVTPSAAITPPTLTAPDSRKTETARVKDSHLGFWRGHLLEQSQDFQMLRWPEFRPAAVLPDGFITSLIRLSRAANSSAIALV
jgi:hypothetical protein